MGKDIRIVIMRDGGLLMGDAVVTTPPECEEAEAVLCGLVIQ